MFYVGHNGWKQYHKQKRPGTRDLFETALWGTLFEGELTNKQMVLVEPMYWKMKLITLKTPYTHVNTSMGNSGPANNGWNWPRGCKPHIVNVSVYNWNYRKNHLGALGQWRNSVLEDTLFEENEHSRVYKQILEVGECKLSVDWTCVLKPTCCSQTITWERKKSTEFGVGGTCGLKLMRVVEHWP